MSLSYGNVFIPHIHIQCLNRLSLHLSDHLNLLSFPLAGNTCHWKNPQMTVKQQFYYLALSEPREQHIWKNKVFVCSNQHAARVTGVVCEASAAQSVKVLLKWVNRKNGTQKGTGWTPAISSTTDPCCLFVHQIRHVNSILTLCWSDDFRGEIKITKIILHNEERSAITF